MNRWMTGAAAGLLTLMMTVPAYAEEEYFIYDDAGIFSEDEYSTLQSMASEVSDRYDCGIYAVIIDDYEEYGSDMNEAADLIYEACEMGRGEERNGQLLLLSLNERDYWLENYGPEAGYAFGNGISRMEDAMLDDFGDDDYFTGVADYISECEFLLTAAAEGDPIAAEEEEGVSSGTLWVIALILGAAIGLPIAYFYKKSVYTVSEETDADQYVTDDGVKFTRREDRFTHTTEVRTKIQHDSDSSSSSGNSSGGGKF